MPADLDTSGEQQPNALLREILAWLQTCIRGDGAPLLQNTVGEIQATNLVPIGYAPLLFCGTPGNPNALPRNGEKLGRCLVKWAEEIATAIQDDELTARHPDGWMRARHGEKITAEWLLSWSELGHWAYSTHDLSIGVTPSNIQEVATQNPLSPRAETTYLKIIAALVNALADEHPGTMKKSNGSVLVGTSKDTGDSGVVGHLIKNRYVTDLKTGALERHIGRAIKGE